MDEVKGYYEYYVKANNMESNFLNHSIVTSVEKINQVSNVLLLSARVSSQNQAAFNSYLALKRIHHPAIICIGFTFKLVDNMLCRDRPFCESRQL